MHISVDFPVQTSEESVNTSYMSQSVVFDCDPSFPVSMSPVLIENEKQCLEAQGTSEGTTTSRSCTTASEEEKKDEKKKKKRGLLSFMRRKEK
ncbi:hypothetical protein B9Z55_024198 [Caenorhabditis nigoni]|uniref:Uncharacterized protein n=1 Tax=Caenorhabditis nigoni TaxID=1611254 RepID=A0A2G5STD8_9PELO|nr:hypothetical protein B9Z55_024198 [Caenorhabditis nigoni]